MSPVPLGMGWGSDIDCRSMSLDVGSATGVSTLPPASRHGAHLVFLVKSCVSAMNSLETADVYRMSPDYAVRQEPHPPSGRNHFPINRRIDHTNRQRTDQIDPELSPAYSGLGVQNSKLAPVQPSTTDQRRGQICILKTRPKPSHGVALVAGNQGLQEAFFRASVINKSLEFNPANRHRFLDPMLGVRVKLLSPAWLLIPSNSTGLNFGIPGCRTCLL